MPILVADVGGTKAVLALASRSGDEVRLEKVHSYASSRFDTFDDVMQAYLSSIGSVPRNAVSAVAGPVCDGCAGITNLSWRICERELEASFGFESVRLINDVEAIAWAVPHLSESDASVLQRGEADPEGVIAVIAPGTGLGEAFLTWNGSSYIAHPTEGGHAGFAPADPEQRELLEGLALDFGHVSVERVCSGVGLSNIYRWIIRRSGQPEVPSVEADIARADDVTPVIVGAALSGESPLCSQAVQLFIDALAAEAGNLALKTLATGGVYLGGGIPLHVIRWLQADSFIDRFCSKGRFSELLRRIPVRVIADSYAPLRGAAAYAETRLPESVWESEAR